MNHMRRYAAFLLMIGTLLAWGQNQPNATVFVPVLARDGKGQPIASLNASDLVIKDGKRTIADYVVSPATSFPLALGIAVDVSGSEQKLTL